ncbi:cbb3-type cytochrome c oxidase subunit 3 [Primorskyibacter aestuariivivens]|uniref:cbb3-type cytochrome c oxidase subunit 3 n=1 Tax=Primorskyibacter aestuariivivens TaxID=1888912 RepID=UPI002300DC2C|nr:cbb3-type cytochrome c oxidase subunit 3 [Primorskyibacter aestuariivivens]MDA7427371.1 cbb3-type cytochrome c oxidase subunit 3 [Primorskyibacter aestuariivivens]
METYSFLRELADSWGLLVLFAFFVGMVAWVFRPGSWAEHRDCANIPLRHDDKPALADEKEVRT